MAIFCVLWILLFYLLRRSVVETDGSGGTWAILFGSITAIIQFFLGYLVSPGGFELTRFLFGFIDIVSLPVLIPLLVYLIMCLVRGFSGDVDFANFALLWLIPSGVLRGIAWSTSNDPILLIAVPLLWTALAAGIPFFIQLMMEKSRWYVFILSGICILILPVLAAGAYWAFFSQFTFFGYLILIVTIVPLVISLTRSILRR